MTLTVHGLEFTLCSLGWVPLPFWRCAVENGVTFEAWLYGDYDDTILWTAAAIDANGATLHNTGGGSTSVEEALEKLHTIAGKHWPQLPTEESR